jgi:FkbM family methyltransferase
MLAPKGDVSFVDIGAYVGDSIEPVRVKYGKRLKSILAFEPSEGSFAKLRQYIDEKNLNSISHCYQFAVGESNKTVSFDSAGGTNVCATVSGGTGTEIQQCALDTLIADSLVKGDVMIKMDIEGFEMSALRGMKKYIREKKPYLAICLYHRAEDIYEIPRYIKKLYPGYKLYIRGGWHLECWAVPERHYI